MPYQIYLGTPELLNIIILMVVFLFVIAIFWAICALVRKRTSKTSDVEAIAATPDAKHGFLWGFCRLKSIIVIMLLNGIILGVAFSGSPVAVIAIPVIQFVICISIPSLVRFASSRQHGILASSIISIVAWLLMTLFIVQSTSAPIALLASCHITGIFYTCAAYKIMRSVAGFSSVFGKPQP